MAVRRLIRWKTGVLALVFTLLMPTVVWGSGTKTAPVPEARAVSVQTPVAGSSVHGKPFPWDRPGRIHPVLHPGSPASAGMVREPLEAMDPFIRQSIREDFMPGAVVLVARRGSIVKHKAYGFAARDLDDQGNRMERPIPMRKDTLFDLASISKIFTSVAAMKLYEEGKFQLEDPVAKYIPEFAQKGKEKVTIRQLMTHTSGFEPGIPIHQIEGSREERLQAVFAHAPIEEPGTAYIYSDLNLITLGALVERLSGKRLDVFVKERISRPLGMKQTMYNPPVSLRPRIAATEYQPWTGRGLVWGSVHDEKAWSLDGVAGHAGVFATAKDLAVFAHMLLNNGKYGGVRILKRSTVELMEKNMNTAFPGDDHGLGWELNQGWYMDALSGPRTMGHTGYTGTSLVMNRDNGVITLALTNRVHPTRNTVSTNPVRRQVARFSAEAIPVTIPGQGKAWFSGYGDNLDRPLTGSELEGSGEGRSLIFDTWYRTEEASDADLTDYGVVEASPDGEHWQTIGEPMSGNSEGWIRRELSMPDDAKYLRFRYHTDDYTNGRGWYVKDPRVNDAFGRRLNVEWSGDGWELRNR